MKYAMYIALILGVFGGISGHSWGQQVDPCTQNPAYCP